MKLCPGQEALSAQVTTEKIIDRISSKSYKAIIIKITFEPSIMEGRLNYLPVLSIENLITELLSWKR